jgi:rhodanese-related sulfurtransferase
MSRKHSSARSDSTEPASRRRHKSQRPRLRLGWIGLGVGILVLVVAALLLLRPRSSSLPAEMSAAQAYQKYTQGAFFLDVRSQDEWNLGHITGSVLIPLDELPARLSELPGDHDIIVVCRSGVRSKEGASILRQAGFTRVSCLTGGLQSWVAAGYPLQQ